MIVIAMALALAILALSARFWRIAAWSALVLMIYEGALRKWVLPQFHEQIYFLKDLLLLGSYAGGFLGARVMRAQPPFQRHAANLVLGVYVLFCLAQMLNPRLPNWMVGLYGFESYLLYIPLMYLVPELIPDEETLRRFSVVLVLLSVAPLALGAVQFSLPPDHAMNRYVWSDQAVATFGADLDHARVTSTFSYITGFSIYLTALGVISLGLALQEKRPVVRVLLYATFLFTIVDVLMTGSRGPAVQLAVATPILLSLTAASGIRRHFRAATLAVVAVVIVVSAAVLVFADARQAFIDRVLDDANNVGRVTQLWTGVAEIARDADFSGHGIGSTLPGSSFLYDTLNTPDAPPWAEAEFEHVIIETGLLGFTLTLAVRLLVAFELIRVMRRSRTHSARPLLAAALVFVVMSLPMQIIVSRTAGMLYWFIAGFAFLPDRWAEARATHAVRYQSTYAVRASALRRTVL